MSKKRRVMVWVWDRTPQYDGQGWFRQILFELNFVTATSGFYDCSKSFYRTLLVKNLSGMFVVSKKGAKRNLYIYDGAEPQEGALPSIGLLNSPASGYDMGHKVGEIEFWQPYNPCMKSNCYGRWQIELHHGDFDALAIDQLSP